MKRMKRVEFINLWLEALESGKYKQGRDVLREMTKKGDYAYCCLGVACELAEVDFEEDGANNVILPKKLSKFMGIDVNGSFYPIVVYRGKSYGSLSSLNDAGVHFETIAHIFREQSALGNMEKP